MTDPAPAADARETLGDEPVPETLVLSEHQLNELAAGRCPGCGGRLQSSGFFGETVMCARRGESELSVCKMYLPSLAHLSLARLVKACGAARQHVHELEDAWQRGAIQDLDGKGGERSNRNIEVRNLLRAALAAKEPHHGT